MGLISKDFYFLVGIVLRLGNGVLVTKKWRVVGGGDVYLEGVGGSVGKENPEWVPGLWIW